MALAVHAKVVFCLNESLPHVLHSIRWFAHGWLAVSVLQVAQWWLLIRVSVQMAEIMTREASSCDLKDLVAKFIPEAIGKDIEKACQVSRHTGSMQWAVKAASKSNGSTIV